MSFRTSIGPPHSQGREERAARAEQRLLEQVRKAGWPQLELDDLDFSSRRWVEHRPDGRLFFLSRGMPDARTYSTACAFFFDSAGTIRFLEPLPSKHPQSRAELEEYQAARERRRRDQGAARKARYDELRKAAR